MTIKTESFLAIEASLTKRLKDSLNRLTAGVYAEVQRYVEDGKYEQCIKAGVLATYKGLPPAIAIEFARRVLPHNVRPSFEETEKICRNSRDAAGAQAA